jgi:hypothetical protein
MPSCSAGGDGGAGGDAVLIGNGGNGGTGFGKGHSGTGDAGGLLFGTNGLDGVP